MKSRVVNSFNGPESLEIFSSGNFPGRPAWLLSILTVWNRLRSHKNKTRMMYRVFGLPVLLLLVGCSSSGAFRKLETIQEDEAGLYIHRPFDPNFAVWNFKFRLDQYEGHFRSGKIKKHENFKLAAGDYIFFRLSPGYVKLTLLRGDPYPKILLLKPGKTTFVEIGLIGRGFFTPPDILMKESDVYHAVEKLMEGEGAIRNENSMDDPEINR